MSSCFASAVRSATAPPNEFPTSAAGRCSATASTNENDSVGSGVSPHPGRSGVSGSGPAYVFLLAEAMAEAGAAAGLPVPLAERLARETVAGSGELLHRSPESAATCRFQSRESPSAEWSMTTFIAGTLACPRWAERLM